jgi:CHAD domain-containing protein
MALEREIKLAAAPDFQLPVLDGLVDGASASDVETLKLTTVYYDTPDLRLTRWRCGLRFREGEGWTVKLPAPSEGEVLTRHELTFPAEGPHPPAAALDLVRAYVRRSTLVPVARLSTVRRRVRLHDPTGAVLAEVDDDVVSVVRAGRVASRFREVEVELGAGRQDGFLDPLLERLRDAGAGPTDPTPKHVRALGPKALEPPEVVAEKIDKKAMVADLIRNVIAGSVASLLRRDPAIRVGDDPEDIHKARVETRRLRTMLRIFRPLLDANWASSLRAELGWLAGEFGGARDRQVLLDRLRGRAAELPPADRPPLVTITDLLAVETDAALTGLALALRSDRYIDLLERLVAAAHAPLVIEDGDKPAVEAVPPLTARAWRKLRKAVKALSSDPPDSELHQIRIMAKRARYAAEAAEPVVGKRADVFAKYAAELQDVLGEHQDAINAQAWLRSTAAAAQPFVAGELCAMERMKALEARGTWPDAWAALDRRRLRTWMN